MWVKYACRGLTRSTTSTASSRQKCPGCGLKRKASSNAWFVSKRLTFASGSGWLKTSCVESIVASIRHPCIAFVGWASAHGCEIDLTTENTEITESIH